MLCMFVCLYYVMYVCMFVLCYVCLYVCIMLCMFVCLYYVMYVCMFVLCYVCLYVCIMFCHDRVIETEFLKARYQFQPSLLILCVSLTLHAYQLSNFPLYLATGTPLLMNYKTISRNPLSEFSMMILHWKCEMIIKKYTVYVGSTHPSCFFSHPLKNMAATFDDVVLKVLFQILSPLVI